MLSRSFASAGALVVLTFLWAQHGAAQVPSPTAPPFAKTFVGVPEFETKLGTRSAGSACLAKFENNPQLYILTVRHLLGPPGGFPQLIPPDQVPSFVTSIRLKYLFAAGSKLYRVQGLKVPETADVKSPLFNVAIFKTQDAVASDAGTVTLEKPSIGETVWVIARVRASTSQDRNLHPARVIDNGARWLRCEFDDPQILPNGASGAPVLNGAGNIVGIYCTHSNREGKVIAFIIPAALLAEVISQQS